VEHDAEANSGWHRVHTTGYNYDYRSAADLCIYDQRSDNLDATDDEHTVSDNSAAG
jgi:hypothetical protein